MCLIKETLAWLLSVSLWCYLCHFALTERNAQQMADFIFQQEFIAWLRLARHIPNQTMLKRLVKTATTRLTTSYFFCFVFEIEQWKHFSWETGNTLTFVTSLKENTATPWQLQCKNRTESPLCIDSPTPPLTSNSALAAQHGHRTVTHKQKRPSSALLSGLLISRIEIWHIWHTIRNNIKQYYVSL